MGGGGWLNFLPSPYLHACWYAQSIRGTCISSPYLDGSEPCDSILVVASKQFVGSDGSRAYWRKCPRMEDTHSYTFVSSSLRSVPPLCHKYYLQYGKFVTLYHELMWISKQSMHIMPLVILYDTPPHSATSRDTPPHSATLHHTQAISTTLRHIHAPPHPTPLTNRMRVDNSGKTRYWKSEISGYIPEYKTAQYKALHYITLFEHDKTHVYL